MLLNAVILVLWGMAGFVALIGMLIGDEQIMASGLLFSLVFGIGHKVFKVSEGGRNSWGMGFSSFSKAFGGKATGFFYIITLAIIIFALVSQVTRHVG